MIAPSGRAIVYLDVVLFLHMSALFAAEASRPNIVLIFAKVARGTRSSGKSYGPVAPREASWVREVRSWFLERRSRKRRLLTFGFYLAERNGYVGEDGLIRIPRNNRARQTSEVLADATVQLFLGMRISGIARLPCSPE